MATLLFSESARQKQYKIGDLRRITSSFLLGVHSLRQALQLFVRLQSGADTTDDDQGDTTFEPLAGTWSDFDAHVGDAACHLRAQMLWDLHVHVKQRHTLHLFEEAIEALDQVHSRLFELLEEIANVKGNVRALGFPTRLTPQVIFERVGLDIFFDTFDGVYSAPTHGDARGRRVVYDGSPPSSSSSPVWSSRSSRAGSLFDSDHASATTTTSSVWTSMHSSSRNSSLATSVSSLDIHDEQCTTTTGKDVAAGAPAQRPGLLVAGRRQSSHAYRQPTQADWDLASLPMIFQFLCYARLTSLCKESSLNSTTGSTAESASSPKQAALFYRLVPEKVSASEIAGLLEAQQQRHPLGEHSKLARLQVKDFPGKASVVKDTETMQAYIAALTVDWQNGLAERMAVEQAIPMKRLLTASQRVSSRAIACTPAWPTFLLLHHSWVLSRTPIFLVVRRFCEQGYHSTFWRVTVDDANAEALLDGTDASYSQLNDRSIFTHQPVDPHVECGSGWTRQPHVIMISNSIDGRARDCDARLHSSQNARAQLHEGDECACADHSAHSKRVTDSNFSAVMSHFFAAHAQYPFLSNDEQDASEQVPGVAAIIRRELGEEVAERYHHDIAAGEKHGTGEYADLHAPQHAFLDVPAAIMRHVQSMAKHNVKPVPVGYVWVES